MNSARLGFFAAFCLLTSASATYAAVMYSLPQVSIVQYGGYINDVFTEMFKNRQMNFEVDLELGQGYYDGTHAIIALPVKGISENRLIKEAETPQGAALCHLFMGSSFQLLVDGKPIEKSKLRITKDLGHLGEEAASACFVCTVRRARKGGLELCLFGQPKEPVMVAKLEDVPVESPGNYFECTLGNVNGARALQLTLFRSRKAMVVFAMVPEAQRAEDEPTTTQLRPSPTKTSPARAKAQKPETGQAGAASLLLQCNKERTGYFPTDDSLPTRPRILWKYPPDDKDSGATPGDPIVNHGIIYFGDDRGQVHAVNAVDGSEKWSREYRTSRFVAAPAIVDENLYLATTDDVKCVSIKTGDVLWSHELPKSSGETSPLIVGDAVFVAGGDGVYAFKRAGGKPIWKQNLIGDRPVNSASFDARSLLQDGISMLTRSAASDGTTLFQPIYDQCRVVALDCTTGTRRWTYSSRGWLTTHPAVSGKFVLFGGHDLYLHCVDIKTGKAVWKCPAGAEVESGPAIANGCVYFASRNARVHCVDLVSGKRIWMHRLDPRDEGSAFCCAPLITDTKVYVGTTTGALCALDAATGEAKWGISLPNGAQFNGFGLATDGKRIFAASHSARGQANQLGVFGIGD